MHAKPARDGSDYLIANHQSYEKQRNLRSGELGYSANKGKHVDELLFSEAKRYQHANSQAQDSPKDCAVQTSVFSDALGGSRFTSETQNVFVYPYSGSYHRSNSKFLSGVLLEKKGDAECSEIQNEGKPKKWPREPETYKSRLCTSSATSTRRRRGHCHRFLVIILPNGVESWV